MDPVKIHWQRLRSNALLPAKQTEIASRYDLHACIDTPIQLIWGEKDPWESLNEAKEWKKNFSNIKRLDIIKGAGHCPHDEEPEETNKLICEFLQETK